MRSLSYCKVLFSHYESPGRMRMNKDRKRFLFTKEIDYDIPLFLLTCVGSKNNRKCEYLSYSKGVVRDKIIPFSGC